MQHFTPTVRVIDPNNARFSVEMRLLGWSRIREMAREANVGLTERRIGFITKEFEIRSDEDGLNRFISVIWNDDTIIGENFRAEFLRKVNEEKPRG